MICIPNNKSNFNFDQPYQYQHHKTPEVWHKSNFFAQKIKSIKSYFSFDNSSETSIKNNLESMGLNIWLKN